MARTNEDKERSRPIPKEAPTTSLDLALAWRNLRAHRLELQKQVDEVQKQEGELKGKLMDKLRKSKSKSVSNGVRLFQLVTTMEPTVQDWDKLWGHVKKTGHFDLLYKRVNPAAVKERWEHKQLVPGVKAFPVEQISDTEAK